MSIRGAEGRLTARGRIGAAPWQTAPAGLTVQRSTTTTRTVISLVLTRPEVVEGRGGSAAEAVAARTKARMELMASPKPQKVNVTYTVSKYEPGGTNCRGSIAPYRSTLVLPAPGPPSNGGDRTIVPDVPSPTIWVRAWSA